MTRRVIAIALIVTVVILAVLLWMAYREAGSITAVLAGLAKYAFAHEFVPWALGIFTMGVGFAASWIMTHRNSPSWSFYPTVVVAGLVTIGAWVSYIVWAWNQ